jgi:hypothetical protein
MHTLTALAVIATLADGLYSTFVGRDGPLPFAAMALVSLFGAMMGAYQRKTALYLSCRTAAGAAQPYRVTQDAGKWKNMPAFNKELGTARDFGSQMQSLDGAERIYRLCVPVLAAAAVVCAVVSSLGRGRAGMLTWCLSAILVSAAPVTGLMASEAGGEWVEEQLYAYDGLHFRREDGSLDTTTNTQRITAIMKAHGFVCDGKRSQYKDLTVFPSEYFCPKQTTGEYLRTENTYCDHHFMGSWNEKSRKGWKGLVLQLVGQKNMTRLIKLKRHLEGTNH